MSKLQIIHNFSSIHPLFGIIIAGDLHYFSGEALTILRPFIEIDFGDLMSYISNIILIELDSLLYRSLYHFLRVQCRSNLRVFPLIKCLMQFLVFI